MTDQGLSTPTWAVLPCPVRALFRAVAEGDKAGIQSAIAQGADPCARDPDGETPVHLATRDRTALRLLFASGADPNVRGPQGMTPLHMAFEPDDIEALLDHGADPEITDDHGNRPLHYLITDGNAASMETLVNHGVDLDALSGEGWRPFDYIQALIANHPNQDWSAVEKVIASEYARRAASTATNSAGRSQRPGPPEPTV